MGVASRHTPGDLALFPLLLVVVACGGTGQGTPSVTPSPIPEAASVVTFTPTPTPEPTPVATSTPMPTAELELATPILSPTPVVPSTPTVTPEPKPTPTAVPLPTPRLVPTPTPAPTPTRAPADAEVVVRASIPPGMLREELEVEIFITPKTMGVSAAQVVLAFDSDSLELVEIIPGPFLGPSPLVLPGDVAEAEGSITYIAARSGPTPQLGPPGTLFIARFHLRDAAEIPRPAVRVETLELVGADFEFVKNVDLVME